MIIETGFLNHVARHPDGRISLVRSEPRTGIFLYLDLTPAEQDALRQVLAEPGTKD